TSRPSVARSPIIEDPRLKALPCTRRYTGLTQRLQTCGQLSSFGGAQTAGNLPARYPREIPKARGGPMAVSDDFSTLKEEVETADQRIRASAAQGATELKAMVDEARTKADAGAAQINTKAQETADQAEAHWHQVQSDWDRHIKRIRERVDAKKAELDANAAENDAEWAEADAYDAVQFARAAIEEAEYAVLDAVLARKDADVLAAAR